MVTEVTATGWGPGRLLLFVHLQKQAANANDHETELKELGNTHWAAPLS